MVNELKNTKEWKVKFEYMHIFDLNLMNYFTFCQFTLVFSESHTYLDEHNKNNVNDYKIILIFNLSDYLIK